MLNHYVTMYQPLHIEYYIFLRCLNIVGGSLLTLTPSSTTYNNKAHLGSTLEYSSLSGGELAGARVTATISLLIPVTTKCNKILQYTPISRQATTGVSLFYHSVFTIQSGI